MSLVSILLGLLSFVLMVMGFVFGMVPVVGAVLSMGAPVVALSGIVCGGLAMSRARNEGDDNGLAVAGLSVSVVAFVLSLLVALTCGLCNACMSTQMLSDDDPFDVFQQPVVTSPTGPSRPNQVSPTPISQPPVVTPPPFPSPPGASCALARTCCLAFTDDDAVFCEAAIGEARRQGDMDGACAALTRHYAQSMTDIGEDPPPECRGG